MNKLVSVIIPSYGGGQYLARSITSVLEQTYKNIEILVVDDNGKGTDNQLMTQEVVNQFSKHENVKYICHPVNKNGSAARNTGFLYSKGEYIALLDDDDIYYPEKIQRQVEAFDKLSEDYGLVYCGVSICRNGKKIGERKALNSEDWMYDLLIHNRTIGSSSLLIKRRVWEQLKGFDESFWRHQDYEFTARVASVCKIGIVDYIGFQYNQEFRNSPKNPGQARLYREHYLEKMKPYIDQLSKEKQRKVVLENRMEVAAGYLKSKDLVGFIKYFIDVKAGIYGGVILFKRLIRFSIKKIKKH